MPTVPNPAVTHPAQLKCQEAMAKDPTYTTLVGSCLDAMTADRNFALTLATTGDQIAAETRDKALLAQHTDAAAAVAMNQKHVILAYAAMWILSVLFVIFLWRKQAALQGEIQLLKRDLEAATKK